MNIKTFRGDSFQDSLDKVYVEFGERAKILHSREVTESRWFGLRKTRYFEITATEPEIAPNPVTVSATGSIAETNNKPTRQTDDSFDAGVERWDKLLRLHSGEVSELEGSVESSLGELRGVDNNLCSSRFKIRKAEHGSATTRSDCSRLKPNANTGSGISDAMEVVPIGGWRRMELSEMNPTLLQRNLLMMLDEVVCFGGPINFNSGRRITVALVGATGVGKTSTIAKIAAYYKLRESRRVGLLTMDVFRIAAADQLQRYADMLEIQFETVSGADKVQAALRRLTGCDLILIDTPGTNPMNEAKIRGINSVLREANVGEVHLLLSATSSFEVMVDTINRFSLLNPTGLTLTKLDEAVGISDVYKMLKSNKLPLKFFTLGQNISEDIEVAGAARLVSIYHHT
jgi:flagellar biosynthesis protein FlhF